jgi:hypothetical protein
VHAPITTHVYGGDGEHRSATAARAVFIACITGGLPQPAGAALVARSFIGLALRTDQPDSLTDTWCGSSLTGVFAREAGRVPGHAAGD